MTATGNFGDENKLGQGGFGSFYKGCLANGQEIAVKRLSENSGQGTEEFKNEVTLLAKLQTRNLVETKGRHWFGISASKSFWELLVVLKIIHRDLKASNVLLDAAMNPKILDFGMARIFGEDQIQARTRRVWLYVAEYAMEGRYSTKSDVFSFGVLLLEMIAGKRNTDSEIGRASPNLIGYVWILWMEKRALDIVDSTLGQSYPHALVLRCIQIGLLCVQENAINRPSMIEVVFMLGNETPLSPPQKPAFLFNGNRDLPEPSTSGRGSSINE
ncbi:Cysteine-rich receptor-like protein kinase 5, partial [Mucuna pruriens]